MLDFDLIVLDFGAMVRSAPQSLPDVYLLEPGQLHKEAPLVPITEIAQGARHRAAADFCWGNKDALAFVASQDGRLTVLGRFSKEERLWALRRAEVFLA